MLFNRTMCYFSIQLRFKPLVKTAILLAGFLFIAIDGGACPEVPATTFLNKELSGLWYEVRKSTNLFSSDYSDSCSTQYYQFLSHNKFVINMTTFGSKGKSSVQVQADRKNWGYSFFSGSFSIHSDTFSKQPDANLLVLHLDSQFALIYFCQNVSIYKAQVAWILSRSEEPDKESVDIIESKLQQNGIDLSMEDVDQLDCAEKQEGQKEAHENARELSEKTRTMSFYQSKGNMENDIAMSARNVRQLALRYSSKLLR